MTDTSAWLLEDQLTPRERARWMYALFSRLAIGLNFIRVPIGASDFTVGGAPYSYDDLPAGIVDPSLARFSIAHDFRYVIPALRETLRVNPHALVLASPWSPPTWMKANGAFNNLLKRGDIISLYLPSLAEYLVKFVKAYASYGIGVKALTPQNEPSVTTNYPGAVLTPPEEGGFIHRYLRPALRRAGLAGVSIYGYDGSWGGYPWTLAGGEAARDIAGIAWHCYVNSPDIMRRFHFYAPRLDQVLDECASPPRASTAEILITAFRNWASRVALWNLALDQNGGPVEHPNIACAGCTGIITVNTVTHTARPTLDFFQLAQLGYYVHPGATRIASSTFVAQEVNPPSDRGINDVAFRNPDGQRVLIAYNNARVAKAFTVTDSGQYFSYRLAPGAMATFTWRIR